MTYLITFTCYGCHLHGSESGSVDRAHNRLRTAMLPPSVSRATADLARMDQPSYRLDERCRQAVLAAIIDVCAYRRWSLLAAHVRTTHVHVVLVASSAPERVMTELKAYASRRLNELRLDNSDRKRWARHGSTRWLPRPDDVNAAIQYVLEEQGAAMATLRPGE